MLLPLDVLQEQTKNEARDYELSACSQPNLLGLKHISPFFETECDMLCDARGTLLS